jgi:hypothetical protein
LPDRIVRQHIRWNSMLDDPTFFDHLTRTADGRGAADILFDEQERNPRVPHARERRYRHRQFDANAKDSAVIRVVPQVIDFFVISSRCDLTFKRQ